MKKMLLLTLAVFVATAVSASASSCPTAPLSVYEGLPSCTVGDLAFSNFTYSSPIVFGTETPAPAADIEVTPVTGTEMGFDFSLLDSATWQVGPDETETDILSFDVAASSPSAITDIDLLSMGSFSENGTASVTEDTPAGNLFTQFASGGITPSDSMSVIPPVGSLTVKGDISLIGGVGGASITNVSTLFSTVPEPSLTLLCLCALGLVPLARRKFIH